MDQDNPWATDKDPDWPRTDHHPPASPDVSPVFDHQELDHRWRVAWSTTPSPSSETNVQPPDEWEVARHEKEKRNRAVPSQLLDSLLHHCQQVSQEIWPPPDADSDDDWRSSPDGLPDLATLLAQLLPSDLTLPPTVPFSATATAKVMNDALKLTRHSPASVSSPLSCLLASKGSLEWEKPTKAGQDLVPDTSHVGWRVLEREDRLNTLDELKPRKAAGGLLSFWNRRLSPIQTASAEARSERSSSPTRSSLEGARSFPHLPSSRTASPSRASNPSVLPPPPTATYPTAIATAPAPSAVSRFLNRFTRTKSAQHSALALSSDDLEFLSDIVPSAIDLLDEDMDDRALDPLTGESSPSPLPTKLLPLIPPPPKQSNLSNHSSSVLSLGFSSGMSVNATSTPTASGKHGAGHAPSVPVLSPLSSPKPTASFSHSQDPHLYLKDVIAPAIMSGQSRVQQGPQPSSQPNTQSRSSILLPPQKPPLLSTPPLLPPPPTSPQTPRPSAFPSITTSAHSSAVRSTDAPALHDSYDSDEEFSAFTSFPSPAATPFPLANSYISRRSPSPPSPPPRRTYERTHYPSSSSASSMFSPASADQLYPTRSSISASSESFDEFVSPPSVMRGKDRKCTPSPPPLPTKPQLQLQQPPCIDAFSSRVHHSHSLSQTTASPTVHTSLINNAFSAPSVSHAEHQRTQSLVDHAATRGGLLWPDSPESDAAKAKVIPPPPSSSTPPRLLTGEDAFDLLSSGDVLGGASTALPTSLSVTGGIGSDSIVSYPVAAASFGAAGSPGKESGSKDRLQLSSSTPILSFSSLVPSATMRPGSLQPTKPKQTGGLSAQDLLFFEGL